MPNYKQTDESLVQIVLDYLRGEELDVIKGQLKSQSINTSCTARYQEMTKHRLDAFSDSILNALSIGGCELHLLSLATAQQHGYTFCYVWHNNQLIYLHGQDKHEEIQLRESKIFSDAIKALKKDPKSPTIHLFAPQIAELITNNSRDPHTPPTTDVEQIEEYKKSPHLYALLKKLAVKHRHLTDLIDLIDEIKPAHNWGLYFIFAAGVTAGTSMLFHLKENIAIVKAWFDAIWPTLSRWLGSTVELLRKTPLVGIVLNIIPLVNAWLQTFYDEAGIDQHKLIKLGLKSMSHFLPIIGFVLCYLAGAAMTIPALTLFITGAIIDVFDSLHTVAKDEYDRRNNPLPSGTEYYSHAAKVRSNKLYERGLLSFLVNFIASLLTTVSVIIWCVFPPSLMIALPTVIFGWCLGMAKHSLLSHIKKEYTDILQRELQSICEKFKPQLDLHHNTSTDTSTSQVLIHKLQTKLELQAQYEEGFKHGYDEGQRTMFSLVAGAGLFKPPRVCKTPDETRIIDEPLSLVSISTKATNDPSDNDSIGLSTHSSFSRASNQ